MFLIFNKMLKYFFYSLLFLLLFMPQLLSQGIITPGGTGAWGNMIYAGVGITTPQPYSDIELADISSFENFESISDMVVSFGVGFGNPAKNIGVQIGSNVLDVSQMDLYNLGAKVHRYIKNGISIGAGVENIYMFGSGGYGDAVPSVYIAITHNLGYTHSPETFLSRISYSIGGGYGRFSELTELDILHNNSNNGTYAFGALQFRVFRMLNCHVEWTGTNLNSGISIHSRIGKIPFSFVFSAADLTKYSGDGVRFLGAVGALYQFGRPRQKEMLDIESDIRLNEQYALQQNIEAHQTNILQSEKVELTDKVKLLEDEMSYIKKNQEKVDYGKKYAIDTLNTNEPIITDNAMDLNDYKIVNISDDETSGYTIEPANYLVIHSLVKKTNATNAIKKYRSIGIDAKIVYNVDKEIHYVCIEKYPVENHTEALKRSTELREQGFEGAWVFYKEFSTDSLVPEDINTEIITDESGDIKEIIDLSNNEIVEINSEPTSNQENELIAPGNYLVVGTFEKFSNAKQFNQTAKEKNIETNISYNKDSNVYYVYSFKSLDKNEILQKKNDVLQIYADAWIFSFKMN